MVVDSMLLIFALIYLIYFIRDYERANKKKNLNQSIDFARMKLSIFLVNLPFFLFVQENIFLEPKCRCVSMKRISKYHYMPVINMEFLKCCFNLKNLIKCQSE